MVTPLFWTEIFTVSPSTVLTLPDLSVVERTSPGTTWYVKILTSWALFSGFNNVSTVPLGNFAKAASVGANTVNGPSPFRVSTSPAAFNAAVRVLNEPLADATSTRVFLDTFLETGTPDLLGEAIVGLGVGVTDGF